MTSEIKVAPGLLIAMPQLADPNFHRGVVLMIEHAGDGSFGLVINRPAQNRLGELLESISVDWNGDPSEVAWLGGPVQPETGWILHEHVSGLNSDGTREILPGLYLTSGADALRRLAQEPPKRMRFLLGYAGWGPRQLEGELAHGSWVNSDATLELIFDTPPEELWSVAVRRLGVAPESLVPASGVH
jgi:putative transcriptional regulator